MARLRKFIGRELLDELIELLKPRFPGAEFTVTVRENNTNARCDIMDILNVLTFTYGNVSLCVGPKEGRPRGA